MRAGMRTILGLWLLLLSSAPGFGKEPRAVGGMPGGVGTAFVDEETAKAMGLVRDYDEPPKPIKITRPQYPEPALRKGIEGTVIVEVLIDRRGRVARRRVLESVRGLDGAALDCVEAWIFRPARKAGRPVAIVGLAPVIFRKDDKPE